MDIREMADAKDKSGDNQKGSSGASGQPTPERAGKAASGASEDPAKGTAGSVPKSASGARAQSARDAGSGTRPAPGDGGKSGAGSSSAAGAKEKAAAAASGGADKARRQRSIGSRIGRALLLVLAAFLAGAIAWIFVGPEFADRLPAPLRAFLPQAESEIPAAVLAAPGRLDRLDERVAQLEQRTAANEAELRTLGPLVADGATARSVAALDERIKALEESVSGLANRVGEGSGAVAAAEPGAPQATTGAIDEGTSETIGVLRERTEALDRRLESLTSRLESMAGRLDPAELESRLAQLEAALAGQPTVVERERQLALTVAVSALERAVREGGPYRDELQTVRRVMPEDQPTLVTLDRWASRGVATRAELADRFQQTVPAILRAAAIPEDAGWFDRLIGRASTLVVVRKTGDVEGGDTDAIVARAESRLMENELEAALEEVEALTGPAARAAAQWIDAVRARLQAEKALRELRAVTVRRIAPGGEG